jgi:DNA-binding MarR family transcriptional regulator
MDDLKQRAEWLRQTRIMLQAASLTHASLELLCWIAAGVDRTPELGEATGRAQTTLSKEVRLLAGVPVMVEGRLRSVRLPLVEVRKHPHARGNQILLTPAGTALILAIFSGSPWNVTDHCTTQGYVD